MSTFEVKDSGKREEFDSGMVRDTEDGKIDYTLIFDGPMLERWAAHLTKGAAKYEARNWMKASGTAELERYRRSLLRHLAQYLRGDVDEDHAAAIFFNVNGIEYVQARQDAETLDGLRKLFKEQKEPASTWRDRQRLEPPTMPPAGGLDPNGDLVEPDVAGRDV